MIKAIIFDVDGVLLDSVNIHLLSWQDTFRQEGIQMNPRDYVSKLNGLSREQGIRNMLPQANEDEVRNLADLKQVHFEQRMQKEEIKPISHVKKTLQKLVKNYPLATASSSKNAPALLNRANLSQFFKVMISGHDITKSKPDPEIFLLAAQSLGVKPESCVVIEDADAGIQAAHAGGMQSIGFDRSHDEKLRKSAQNIITSFDQLLEVIPRLS